MLATLYPEYESSFGEGKSRTNKNVSHDPLISNYGRSVQDGRDDRQVLARWFYQGKYVEKVTKILNKLMREDGRKTQFQCERKTARDSTFTKVIVGSVNEGLPVMLGWHTADYGDHAVLITGYWEGKDKWFLTNDPGGGKEISWDWLKEQKTENFEVGLCNVGTHNGYRPMKRVTKGNSPIISRWNGRGYEEVPFD